MQNNCFILLLPVLALLFTSCNGGGMCMKGEGDIETRSLDIARFEGVNVNGPMQVFVRNGSLQQVEVKGQPNVLDQLDTRVQGGVWDIGIDLCLRDHEPIQVYITAPALTSVSVGGSGYLELEDVFRSGEFDASVSGSGDMKLRVAANRLSSRISGSGAIMAAGVADQQEVSVSGSGNYNSFDLITKEAEVDISGSGRAEVNVQDRLKVDISGSGRVYHQGSPFVNSDVSGSGKVIKK